MREQIDRTTASQRIAVTVLSVFGGLALLLAGIGLYGVMVSSVAQGTRELALRLALGADGAALCRGVLGRGLGLGLAGTAIGAVAASSLTRLMGYLLYGVSPRDPLVFGAAACVLIATAIVASAVPSWRAMRTDPIVALRG
jgi:ABC-type antimicrobial peptide transport system permease subunit